MFPVPCTQHIMHTYVPYVSWASDGAGVGCSTLWIPRCPDLPPFQGRGWARPCRFSSLLSTTLQQKKELFTWLLGAKGDLPRQRGWWVETAWLGRNPSRNLGEIACLGIWGVLDTYMCLFQPRGQLQQKLCQVVSMAWEFLTLQVHVVTGLRGTEWKGLGHKGRALRNRSVTWRLRGLWGMGLFSPLFCCVRNSSLQGTRGRSGPPVLHIPVPWSWTCLSTHTPYKLHGYTKSSIVI